MFLTPTSRVRPALRTKWILLLVLTACAWGAVPAVNAQDADLGVTKSGPAQATAGANVTYTIDLLNSGPDVGAAVTLTDPLPGGTTFVSMTSPQGWQCTTPSPGSGGTVSCSTGSMAVGETAHFTLTARINPESPTGTTYTNTATVTTRSNDPNEENNASSTATTVPGSSADLSVSKSVNKQAVLADTDVTYTIVVANNGPDAAQNASLTDTLPGDLTFVSFAQSSGPTWNCTTPAAGSGGTVSCTIASLNAGTQSTFRLVGHIPRGTQTGTAYYNTATVTSATDSNEENNSYTVDTQVYAAAPTITTTASGSVAIGGSISDSATLAGGQAPTGSITFFVYGPNDSTCGGTPAFASTVAVNGNGTYNSGGFTPGTAGVYRFVASYSGDANNIAIANACNDANESVTVTKAAPTISTTASAGVIAGSGSVSDRATIAGGYSPTGSITFKLYGPNDSSCGAAAVFTSTVQVSGNGSYNSGSFTPTQPGTYNWIATYNGDANNTSVAGRCGDANESVVVAQPTPTPTPTPVPTPSDVLNLSTRERIQPGENVAIGGFIVTGTAPKKLVIRGLGPSLANKGVAEFLPDPVLELHAANGALLLTNDNWKDDPAQATQLQASGLAPTNDLEAAIAATLAPGSYTAIERGKGLANGVGLVEIYDIDTAAASALANISTRGLVLTSDNVMIGGFTLGRTANAANVVLRAIGPSLAQRGITNPLSDPTLELKNANGATIGSNDNWNDDSTQATKISSYGLAPTDNRESALFASLPAGQYTVIVAGKTGATGVALVEIYRVP